MTTHRGGRQIINKTKKKKNCGISTEKRLKTLIKKIESVIKIGKNDDFILNIFSRFYSKTQFVLMSPLLTC